MASEHRGHREFTEPGLVSSGTSRIRAVKKLKSLAKAVTITAALTSALGASAADARPHHRSTYSGRSYYSHVPQYRYCRHSSGQTGLIAGGIGGALVGRSIVGHGLLGTIAGAAGGALAGRAIDRTLTASQRCYYR